MAVKARDSAGLESNAVQSTPVLVDITPPEGVACSAYSLQAEARMTYSDTASFLHTYSAAFDVSLDSESTVLRVTVTGHIAKTEAEGYVNMDELNMPLFFKHTKPGKTAAEHVFLSPLSGNKTLTVTVEAKAEAILNASLYQCSHPSASVSDAVTLHQVSEYSVLICARIRDDESGIRSLMAGIGSTKGGLQTRPWSLVGQSGHAVYDIHVQHGTRLYATVVAENYAGQKARFISQAIIMDRTAPMVSEVKVTLKYEQPESMNEETDVFVLVEWNSTDDESGVISCDCELGRSGIYIPAYTCYFFPIYLFVLLVWLCVVYTI